MTSEETRITMKSPLGDDRLIFARVQWSERLGRSFQGALTVLSTDDSIDALDLIGQPFGIGVDTESSAFLHGIVTEFERGETRGGYTSYALTLAPWIELLRHAGGNRIYQQQSAVDIFKSIANDRGFSGQLDDKLSGTYRVRPYCVQYGESDLHFLSRLLEEEGIYYYFTYDADGHTLVLADDVSGHETVPGYSSLEYFDGDTMGHDPRAFGWRESRRYGSTSFILRDYDFFKPRAEMTVRETGGNGVCDWPWYAFPGRYFESSDGSTLARVRSQAFASDQSSGSFSVNITAARTGQRLALEAHPRDDVNQEYLITGALIRCTAAAPMPGMSGVDDFACQLTVQASSSPFRTLPTATKPLARGPHIATVVGPDGEEIWTDANGRIKVQFAWDLLGENNDSSSCWMRVVQPWTGKGFGGISIPRIGEEVVVQFIDGDIDRPIVTGRVHNADRMPPETLPDAQAKTIFRTRSTKGGDVDAFHELTFDDTKDAESIFLHSERDFIREVENNDSLKVGFDKQSPGDQSIEIYNNQDVKIGIGSGNGSQTIEIEQDRTVSIDSGNDTLTVKKGDQTITIDSGNQTQNVNKGDLSINVKQGDHKITVSSGAVTIEAGSSITLKCGQSKIELTPSAINIQGTQVSVKGQSKVNLAGPDVSVAADGQLQMSGNMQASLQSSAMLGLKGGIVQIN